MNKQSSGSSTSLDDEKTSLTDCYVDSGVICTGPQDSGVISSKNISFDDTPSNIIEDEKEICEEVSARIDSGLDLGLSESFSELDIRNNFDKEITPVAEAEPAPWQIYYKQDENGDTQLHIAIVHGLTDAVLALLHMCPYPALLDIRNDSGRAAIHLAVLTKQPHIARRLLIAGAKVNSRDADGNTALHLASCNGDLSCIRALTAPLAPVPNNCSHLKNTRVRTLPQALDQKNYDGETCVHLAALGGHINILRHLVWFGADINATENKSGRTALHLAIERRDEALLSYLLTECPCISLNARTYAGETALQLGNKDSKEILLKAGYIRQDDESDFESESESDDDDDSYEIEYSNPNYFNAGLRTSEAINVA